MGFRFLPTTLSEVSNHRLMGLLLLLPTTAVLCVAFVLNPDPAGLGTHTQLGLKSCSVVSFVGVPCPMCGMTTTFSLMAQGQWLRGVMNQPFGAVLFFLTVGSTLLGWVELFAPRGRLLRCFRWASQREVPIFIGLFSGLVVGWVYKIFLIGIF